ESNNSGQNEFLFVKLLKLNSPEWYYIVMGSLAALVNGAIIPLVCITFGETINNLFLSISGAELTKRLRVKAFASMLKQDMEWFDKQENHSGAICQRLQFDALAVQSMAGFRIGLLIETSSTFIIGLGFSFVFSWQLTLIIIAFYLFAFTCIYLQVYTESTLCEKTFKILEQASVKNELVHIDTYQPMNMPCISFLRYLNELY
ncbi:unnamed protein product, partial [Didymodactylos carnosus]